MNQELALLRQVGLAGLVDQLGDLPHRLMHREALDAGVSGEAEQPGGRADDEAEEEQRVPVQPPEEGHGMQVGQDEAGFSSPVVGFALRRRRRGHHGQRHGEKYRQKPCREQTPSTELPPERHFYLTSS
jgi:hypothetical protein